MKCPRCFAMCADTDAICHGCQQPFQTEAPKMPFAYRIAMIGACLGACALPLIVDPATAQRASKGISINAAVLAGVGGCIGGVIGLAFGGLLSFLFRSKDA